MGGLLALDWGTGADVLSAAADWALVTTAALSAWVALGSYRQAQRTKRDENARIQEDIRHRNWVDAKALYPACLDDQLENPGFRASNWLAVKGDAEQEYRYRVFMNKLLWSLEGLLDVDSPGAEWRRSAEDIGRAWAGYFQDAEFLAFEWNLYSEELREAVATGVKATGVADFTNQVEGANRTLAGNLSSRRSPNTDPASRESEDE